MPRSCLLIKRATTDTAGGPVPSVPSGWYVSPEAGNWVTIYPYGRASNPGVFLHAWLAVRQSGQGAWVLFGPRAWLDQIQALVTNSWATVADLRADNGAVAVAIKSAWVDDRTRDAQGNLIHPADLVVAVRKRIAGYSDDDAETSV